MNRYLFSLLQSQIDALFSKAALVKGSAGNGLVAQQNSVPSGSGNATVTAISAGYIPSASGKLLITYTLYGTDGTVNDPIAYQLSRGTTNPTGAPNGTLIGGTPEGESGGAAGNWIQTLSYAEHLPVGVLVQYAISATSLAGHALTTSGTAGVLSIVELPGTGA